MSGKEWDKISLEAKHLIKKLLEVDPEKRLNTDKILQHPWFKDDPDVVIYAHTIMLESTRRRFELEKGEEE